MPTFFSNIRFLFNKYQESLKTNFKTRTGQQQRATNSTNNNSNQNKKLRVYLPSKDLFVLQAHTLLQLRGCTAVQLLEVVP